MTLFYLALGLLIYTAAIVKCAEIERDCKWRQWIENFRPKFGPDSRDRYGVHRRDWIKGNRDRDRDEA